MAISITSDLQVITTADTTTASGTFYRLNGVNTGNPLADLLKEIRTNTGRDPVVLEGAGLA